MNISMIRGMLGSFSERTKLIAVAVAAFIIGMVFSGGGKAASNGRFVPLTDAHGVSTGIVDTSTGQTWFFDPNDGHHYRKGPGLTSWF